MLGDFPANPQNVVACVPTHSGKNVTSHGTAGRSMMRTTSNSSCRIVIACGPKSSPGYRMMTGWHGTPATNAPLRNGSSGALPSFVVPSGNTTRCGNSAACGLCSRFVTSTAACRRDLGSLFRNGKKNQQHHRTIEPQAKFPPNARQKYVRNNTRRRTRTNERVWQQQKQQQQQQQQQQYQQQRTCDQRIPAASP